MDYGKCLQCEKPLSPGDYFISQNKVCMMCVRRNHAKVTGGERPKKRKKA